MKNNIKLLIGTPAYTSMVHTDYLHSVMSYTQVNGLYFSIMTLGNESLITRGRNKIFSYFVHSDFDYLLFLDADILFPAQDLVKLIQHDKDLIGAPVILKDFEREVLNYGKVLDDSQNPLLKVDRIGNAVMLISKQLAKDIAQKCKENGDVFYHNNFYSRGDRAFQDKEEIYDCFKVGIKDGEYLSEDYWFCKLAQELGYDVFVDISCSSVHQEMLPLIYNGRSV